MPILELTGNVDGQGGFRLFTKRVQALKVRHLNQTVAKIEKYDTDVSGQADNFQC